MCVLLLFIYPFLSRYLWIVCLLIFFLSCYIWSACILFCMSVHALFVGLFYVFSVVQSNYHFLIYLSSFFLCIDYLHLDWMVLFIYGIGGRVTFRVLNLTLFHRANLIVSKSTLKIGLVDSNLIFTCGLICSFKDITTS